MSCTQTMEPPENITAVLRAWQAGGDAELDQLFPTLYDQLRKQAAGLYAANPSPTLQPTALVNEAYMRLAQLDAPWQSRAHFFAVASVIMRRILVDSARSRSADKRGAGVRHVQIEDAIAAVEDRGIDLLVLDDALTLLAKVDPRQARIVELRFFGGLSVEEVATILDTSTKTVQRGWTLARAWLQKYLEEHRDV